MRELRVNDAAFHKMVMTSDNLAGVIHGIDNDDAIRESNDGVVSGGLDAAAKKATGYLERTVGAYAKHLEAYSKAIREAAGDFVSTDQANVSSFFSMQ